MPPAYATPPTAPRLATRKTADSPLVDWAAVRDVYDAHQRPAIQTVFVEPTELDGCAGCPDAQGTPNDAEAEIVYQHAGSAWVYRIPVARCCSGAQLAQLLAYPQPLAELRIEIPIPLLRAAAAV
jgi:hypothetical protein